jgi:cobalt-zinc-cadmium efflux system protein
MENSATLANNYMENHLIHQQAKNKKALLWSGVLTGLYFILELAVGLLIGSVAVVSDALHTFSAVGGVLIALAAAHYAAKAPSKTSTFALYRVEILAAFINGLFLLVMALIVIWVGIQRLPNPPDLPTTPMLLIAVGGLVTEFISLYLLYEGQGQNLNVRGAFWHVIQTFVGSLGIIVSALVIRFTGFLAIDPLIGILFGLILIWASYRIIRDSARIFLEMTPENLDLLKIKTELEKLPNVKNLHIHAWTLTSGKNLFTAHVLVRDLKKTPQTLQEIDRILKEKYEIYFTTLQVEETPTTEEPREIEFLDKEI